MSARPVRIGRSATGLGLFATKPIESGAYIVTYRGRRIPTAEAQDRERRFGAKYMFEINRHWTIDGSSRRNLGRYINHSCDANAEARLRTARWCSWRCAASARRGDHPRLRRGIFRSLPQGVGLPLRRLPRQAASQVSRQKSHQGRRPPPALAKRQRHTRGHSGANPPLYPARHSLSQNPFKL